LEIFLSTSYPTRNSLGGYCEGFEKLLSQIGELCSPICPKGLLNS